MVTYRSKFGKEASKEGFRIDDYKKRCFSIYEELSDRGIPLHVISKHILKNNPECAKYLSEFERVLKLKTYMKQNPGQK